MTSIGFVLSMDEWKTIKLIDGWMKICNIKFVDGWIKNHTIIKFISGWNCLVVVPQ
jgi:hypothetical protein